MRVEASFPAVGDEVHPVIRSQREVTRPRQARGLLSCITNHAMQFAKYRLKMQFSTDAFTY